MICFECFCSVESFKIPIFSESFQCPGVQIEDKLSRLVQLKTELHTAKLVTANVYVSSSNSNGGLIKKVSFNFIKVKSEVFFGLFFVKTMYQRVVFQL